MISIVCLVALLLSTSSLSYYYWLQEQAHEAKVFAQIESGAYQKQEDHHSVLSFTVKDKAVLPAGYQWEEKGREFSYKGMFYDIISIQQTKEGWVIKAESDEEEAAIVANQKKVHHLEHEAAIASKATSKSKSTNLHLNLSFSIYEPVHICGLRPVTLGIVKTRVACYIVASLHSYSGEITHPPETV